MVVVDVIEAPFPGVVSVNEFEATESAYLRFIQGQ